MWNASRLWYIVYRCMFWFSYTCIGVLSSNQFHCYMCYKALFIIYIYECMWGFESLLLFRTFGYTLYARCESRSREAYKYKPLSKQRRGALECLTFVIYYEINFTLFKVHGPSHLTIQAYENTNTTIRVIPYFIGLECSEAEQHY